MSWEHPNGQLREASLWASLQLGQPKAVKAGWQRYEDSRSAVLRTGQPAVAHEIDRLVVAQVTGDEALRERALAAIAAGLNTAQGRSVQARFCGQSEPAPRWRLKQRQARVQAAKLAGVCAKA